jgi:hypothetical protein
MFRSLKYNREDGFNGDKKSADHESECSSWNRSPTERSFVYNRIAVVQGLLDTNRKNTLLVVVQEAFT